MYGCLTGLKDVWELKGCWRGVGMFDLVKGCLGD